MAKKKGLSFTKKSLGLTLFVALLIQFVFPIIKLGSLSWIGTLLVVLVAIYLFFL